MTKQQSSFRRYLPKYEDDFTTISNKLISDKSLEDSDFRFLVYLFSNRPEWQVYLCNVSKKLGWSGKKITKAVNRLYRLGYIRKKQTRNERGRFSHYDFEFHHEPIFFEENSIDNSDIEELIQNAPSHNEYEPDSGFRPTVTPQTKCPHNEYEPDALSPLAVNDQLPLPLSTTKSCSIQSTIAQSKNLKKAMPYRKKNEEGATERAVPSLNFGSKAMDRLPSKQRKKPRNPEHEARFQWLMSLEIVDENGNIDENEMSWLSYRYTKFALENAYSHLIYKEQCQGFTPKSRLKMFKHLLKNEGNPMGVNVEKNRQYAQEFAKKNGWSSLEIHQKYCQDADFSGIDLNLNMEPKAFEDSLLRLYNTNNRNRRQDEFEEEFHFDAREYDDE